MEVRCNPDIKEKTINVSNNERPQIVLFFHSPMSVSAYKTSPIMPVLIKNA